jgi:catechol-2,3-dioxygenase
MTVTAELELVALDAADIETLSSFYTALTGATVVKQVPDWITIRLPAGPEIAFQAAPDHVAPQWPGQARPQQLHLDLLVDGLGAATARALELGATRLADGASWVTLADPAGHPFDLCQRDGLEAPIELFAVTIDAPDASGLAHFYADLLNLEVTYDGAEGALVGGGATSVMVQQIDDYQAPHWPDPDRPQQGHLDIIVGDLDAGEARALDLGAERLAGGSKTFRVFADPAGHPFCLTSQRSSG